MGLKDTLEIIVKGLGLLGAGVVFAIGLWQYQDSKQKEFYAQFWNRRLDLYVQASQAASNIAVSSSLETAADFRRAFWALYYGPMSVVEDLDVKGAMQEFGRALSAVERDAGDPKSLQQPAYRLATVLRDSLGRSWNQPFLLESK